MTQQRNGGTALNTLYDIPEAAALVEPGQEIPAGGLGAGHFTFRSDGGFGRWRLGPGLIGSNACSPVARFHLWVEQAGGTALHTLSTLSDERYPWGARLPAPPIQRALFPLTWTEYVDGDLGVHLTSLSFSPVIVGAHRESSQPIYVIAWRAHNPTPEPLKAAMMLTWAYGWPDPVHGAVFDFQHDNLCLTGSLGKLDRYNRQAVAVPDLHYIGIYKQGIEPWDVSSDGTALLADFAEDGELDPAVARGDTQGAAAWVKFSLAPGETKEVPFIIVWHFPFYDAGPLAGKPRYYTQYLGKRRPDNAVVWLAEQAVQHYGGGSPNYHYWLQRIMDWHNAVLADNSLSPQQHCAAINKLASILRADTVWSDDGQFALTGPDSSENQAVRDLLTYDLPFGILWPRIAAALKG